MSDETRWIEFGELISERDEARRESEMWEMRCRVLVCVVLMLVMVLTAILMGSW